jgi:ribosome-binding factor A
LPKSAFARGKESAMSSRRLLKAAAAIREVVSMAILAEMRDPRVRDVTVLGVEVSPDMRHAKVHVSIMGDETKQNLALRGLQSAAGFLQSKIASQIDTRYTPRLMFVLDQGVKKSIEMARILKQVLPPETSNDETMDETPATEEAEENPTNAIEHEQAGDEESDEHGRNPPRRPR